MMVKFQLLAFASCAMLALAAPTPPPDTTKTCNPSGLIDPLIGTFCPPIPPEAPSKTPSRRDEDSTGIVWPWGWPAIPTWHKPPPIEEREMAKEPSYLNVLAESLREMHWKRDDAKSESVRPWGWRMIPTEHNPPQIEKHESAPKAISRTIPELADSQYLDHELLGAIASSHDDDVFWDGGPVIENETWR